MYCYALLSEGEKEVVNELERMLQPQERGWQKLLQIFFTPLSRISNAHKSSQRTATSSLGEVSSTTQQQPLSIVIPSVSEGIQPINNSTLLQGKKNNSTETIHSPLTTHHSLKHVAFTLAEGATHVAHCNNLRKIAFTLAEVLITLGIIGVVAALTLPSVITNYQKKQTVTQLKVAYQAVSEVIERAKLDYGDTLEVPENVYNTINVYTNNINLSKLYLDPYFTGAYRYSGKSINIKDKSNKGYFILNYAGSGYGDKNPLCTTKGFCYWVINHSANYYHIIIDINGPKAPNIAGRDVFLFTLNGQYIPGKGIFTIDNPKAINNSGNTTTNECNNDTQGYWNGSSCAALIINNNWEIPKDYPW